MKVKNYIQKIKMSYSSVPIGVKASMAFIFASLLTQGISIITMPIFTRIMSVSDIGTVTIYNSWEAIIGIIASLALTSGSFSIAMMEFKEERNEYISSILILSTFSSLVIVIIFQTFSNQIKTYVNLSDELFYLMFVGFCLMPATNYWLMKNRYEYKYKRVVILTVATSIFGTILGISAVVYSKNIFSSPYSLASIRLFAVKLIPYAVSLVLYIWLIFKSKHIFKKKYVTFALSYSLPLLIHAFSKQMLDISDRVMIEYFEGLEAVGIYGLLYSLSTLSLIIWGTINSSLIPFIFKHMESYHASSDDINLSKIQSVSKSLITIYFFFSVFLMLISPEIVKILATPDYYSAIYLMPPVATGIFFTSFYNTFSNILLYYKKTKLIMVATIIAATINVILNYLFIPVFGFIAAAYTTLIAYLVLAIVQFLFMKKASKNIKIFDDKYLWSLALIMICVTVVVNFLYVYTLVRYLTLTLILITALLKRKRIKEFKANILKGTKYK